jgi:hypothetical protein
MKGLFTLLCTIPLFAIVVDAQENVTKYEAGAQFTFIRINISNENRFGFGGRFTYNLLPNFAIDSQWDITPQTSPDSISVFSGGRTNQLFLGLKMGLRKKQFGVFGKVRPGLITYGNSVKSVTTTASTNNTSSTFNSTFTLGRRTDPSLDMGGVLEIYPAKKWILRYDFGDTVVFHGDGPNFNVTIDGSPFLVNTRYPGPTLHSFQFSTGLSYRF